MLKKRLSTPRAATVVVLAAVLAATVAVVPSLAQPAQKSGAVLTVQRAAKTYLSNQKASTLYLRKKAASNLYVAKAEAPLAPVVGIAAGTALFGPVSATTAGYIPAAFTSFATKATASSAIVTFSGNATCTAEKPTADLACPVQILVDGQSTGKVNLAPATASSPAPAPLVHTIVQTTVLAKGGHTIAVQYAGASKVTFTLKSWNLSVEAYPQPEEAVPTEAAPTTKSGSGGSTKGS